MALDTIFGTIVSPANSLAFPVAIRANCSVDVEVNQPQRIQHGLLHRLDSWHCLSTEPDSALKGVGLLFLRRLCRLFRQSYRSFRLGKRTAEIRPEYPSQPVQREIGCDNQSNWEMPDSGSERSVQSTYSSVDLVRMSLVGWVKPGFVQH